MIEGKIKKTIRARWNTYYITRQRRPRDLYVWRLYDKYDKEIVQLQIEGPGAAELKNFLVYLFDSCRQIMENLGILQELADASEGGVTL